MGNPFREAMGGENGHQGGAMNVSGMFRNFMQNFVGDPTQALQQKLNAGEMTQQQYLQLRGIAEQILSTLPH